MKKSEIDYEIRALLKDMTTYEQSLILLHYNFRVIAIIRYTRSIMIIKIMMIYYYINLINKIRNTSTTFRFKLRRLINDRNL